MGRSIVPMSGVPWIPAVVLGNPRIRCSGHRLSPRSACEGILAELRGQATSTTLGLHSKSPVTNGGIHGGQVSQGQVRLHWGRATIRQPGQAHEAAGKAERAVGAHANPSPLQRRTGQPRGDTDPFRWDCGIDAQNAAADVWEFQLERVPAGQTFQFKPLINDTTYSTGDNYVGTGGQALDIYPAF
jgi:hypothetical protein